MMRKRPGKLEERIERVDHHQVEVEEQGLAAQVGQFAAEHRELLPAKVVVAGRQSQRRQRHRLDPGIEPFGGIAEADEPVRTLQGGDARPHAGG